MPKNNATFLVVGLGNPESKYEQTWHNAGFKAVEALQRLLDAPYFGGDKKHTSLTSETVYEHNKIILAKPQTYMNNSGQAVHSLVQYYKVALDDVIIIHDEVDLPFGEVKISFDASAAGHRGVRSIIESLSSQAFTRVRIGIGRPRKPIPIPEYVLQKVPLHRKLAYSKLTETAAQATRAIIDSDLETAQSSYN